MLQAGRDERTLQVENASYRLGFHVVSWGLLCDWLYRGLLNLGIVPDPLGLFEHSWDLPLLLEIAFVVTIGYQARHGTLWPQVQANWRDWVALGAVVLVVQVVCAWVLIGWLVAD